MRWAAPFLLYRFINIQPPLCTVPFKPIHITCRSTNRHRGTSFVAHMLKCDCDDAIAGAASADRWTAGVSLQGSVPHGTFYALTFDWQRMTNQRSASVRGAAVPSASFSAAQDVAAGRMVETAPKGKVTCGIFSSCSLLMWFDTWVVFSGLGPRSYLTEEERAHHDPCARMLHNTAGKPPPPHHHRTPRKPLCTDGSSTHSSLGEMLDSLSSKRYEF